MERRHRKLSSSLGKTHRHCGKCRTLFWRTLSTCRPRPCSVHPPTCKGLIMPEHYTKNTLECTVWCNHCGRTTQHRVDSGRRGPYLECISRLELKIESERIRKGLEA